MRTQRATRANSELSRDCVTFDTTAAINQGTMYGDITNIGKSLGQTEDADRTLRIGFKAVFAYLRRPKSGPQHSRSRSPNWFCQACLILARSGLGQRPVSSSPFNNPRRPRKLTREIRRDQATSPKRPYSSFQSKSISWQIGQKPIGRIVRNQHTANHIEVEKQTYGETASNSHFLRFSNPVDGLEKQSVSVAFALDYLPNVTAFDPGKSLAEQLRIVSAKPGCVAVFFPRIRKRLASVSISTLLSSLS